MEGEAAVSADGNGLEILGPQDGSISSPSGGPSFIIDYAGEEDLLLSGRSDASHPDSLVPDFSLDGFLDLQGIHAPEGSGGSKIYLLIVYPKVNRFVRGAFYDHGVISRPFQVRSPISPRAGIA